MILIIADHIVTQNPKRQIIKNGAILVKDDKIFDLGETEKITKKIKKERLKINKIIKGENFVVTPGLINAHTHSAMTLLRGFADDLPLEEWWFKKVFPFEAKLKGEDIYWGALLGGLEMIKSGTTCFADFYFFAGEIARAVKDLGMRTNIGIPLLDFSTPEFKNPDQALAAMPSIVKNFGSDSIQFSLAPHMLQTTSLQTYKKTKKIAAKYNLLLQTHLSETKQEVKNSLRKYKQTPVNLLIENKILDRNSIAAHACWLNDQEIKLLAKHKVNICHCPSSNMKLASGVMPWSKLFKAGINISLGTDGACSNNNLDMFVEMKTAALLHKINEKDPTAASGQNVLDMATINGAKALGLEKQIGSLEIGKKADLAILDFDQPHLTPCYDIISHLVYAAKGNDVKTLIINGRIIMENRKVLTIDEKATLKIIKEKYSKQ